MTSGDDKGRDESESEFGPPVSGFGPPLNDFGPPTGADDMESIGWSPVGEPERPTLGWQPADAAAPRDQYRAPDPSAAPDAGSRPESPRAPESAPPQGARESSRAPESSHAPAPDTRRAPASDQARGADSRRADSSETVRYSASAPDTAADEGSWWHTDDGGYPPAPPTSAPARESSGSLWDDDELAKKLAVPRAGSESRGSASGSSSGSLWDDDELAKKLSPPRPAATSGEDEPQRNKGVLLGGIAAAAVLVVALALVVVFATRGGGSDDPVDPKNGGAGTVDAIDCVARTEGTLTYGNGPGDTTSGANAIFGYQHAYYTERSAEKVHTFVAPGANVQPPTELQQTIDQHIPSGTTYCLRIAPTTPNQYNVEVTEQHPDGTKSVYLEVITTVNQGGRNLIQLIQSF